ncbi:hypothetical protein QR685DRAFT_366204 [Neurospora intermedia]|uniref:Secreted protein n=1 Tax=Neurospora intermedia TaxID=5142 RepID=A0ABR3D4Q4_NEUIN
MHSLSIPISGLTPSIHPFTYPWLLACLLCLPAYLPAVNVKWMDDLNFPPPALWGLGRPCLPGLVTLSSFSAGNVSQFRAATSRF